MAPNLKMLLPMDLLLFEIELLELCIIITANFDPDTSKDKKNAKEHVTSTSNEQGHEAGNFFEIQIEFDDAN